MALRGYSVDRQKTEETHTRHREDILSSCLLSMSSLCLVCVSSVFCLSTEYPLSAMCRQTQDTESTRHREETFTRQTHDTDRILSRQTQDTESTRHREETFTRQHMTQIGDTQWTANQTQENTLNSLNGFFRQTDTR